MGPISGKGEKGGKAPTNSLVPPGKEVIYNTLFEREKKEKGCVPAFPSKMTGQPAICRERGGGNHGNDIVRRSGKRKIHARWLNLPTGRKNIPLCKLGGKKEKGKRERENQNPRLFRFFLGRGRKRQSRAREEKRD